MKLTSLASFSLLGLTLLAGCPSNDHDAKFASATDEQLGRTYESSSGSDVSGAFMIGLFLGGSPSDATACPRVLTDGNDTTLTGGCDTTEGDHWEGTIAIHNMPGLFTENPLYDENEPSTVSFEELHITNATDDFESKLDGVVSVDQKSNTVDENLTILFKGIETTTVLSLTCDKDTNLCTAADDADFQLTGLGGASIEGTWKLGTDTPAGAITLKGADTLVFDQAHVDANGCVPYTIGDKHGTACDPNNTSSDPSAAQKLTPFQRVVSGASKKAQR